MINQINRSIWRFIPCVKDWQTDVR